MPFGGILTAALIAGGAQIGGSLIGASAAEGAGADLAAKGNLIGQSLDKATGGAINAGYQGIGQANTALTGGLKGATGAITGGVGASNALLGNVLGGQLGILSPYLQAGGQGVNSLAQFLAPGGAGTRQFTADMMSQYDPGYNFRLQQGTRALQMGAAARGGILGGAQQKALSRYGQDYASQEYNNAWNRYMAGQRQQYSMLSGLAGLGERAVGMGTEALGQYGARAGGNLMQGGLSLGQANLTTGSELANTAMQGNQWIGNIGLQGANLAGNAYMGGALGGAAGNLAGANILAQGVGNAGSILGGGILNYYNQPGLNLPIDNTISRQPGNFGTGSDYWGVPGF